jgi:hypothetical protein
MIADSPNDNRRIVRIGIIIVGSAPPVEGFKEGLAADRQKETKEI